MIPFLKHLFYIYLIVVLSSCSSKKDQLSKVWFYTDGYSSSGQPLKTDKVDSSFQNKILTPACFLNLQSDGNYSCYLFKFDYGTWKIEDNAVLLTNANKEQKKLPLIILQDKLLMLGMSNPVGDSMNCNFESAPNAFNSVDENPFSVKNNLWRLAPGQKETDEEITKRLLNHFSFWEKYFAWGFKTQQQTLDVRSTPTPLKLYGNGFTLKPFDSLPLAWKQCFYDEEDCRKANDKLETFIKTNDIAWPHTESKYKMFLSAFQQMQQIMK